MRRGFVQHMVDVSVLLALAGCATTSTRADRAAVVASLSRARIASADADLASARRPELRGPLTSERAVAIALLSSPETSLALTELGVARAALVDAATPPDLHLGAVIHSHDGTQNFELEAEIDVTALVFAHARARAHRPSVEAARARVAQELGALAVRVRTAFVDAMVARQVFDLSAVEERVAQAAAETSRAMFVAGNVPELHVAEHEAAVAAASLERQAAEEAFVRARFALERAIGISHGDWVLGEALADLGELPDDRMLIEPRAVEASFARRAAAGELLAMRRMRAVTNTTGHLPTVHAGVSAERDEGEWAVGPSLVVGVPLGSRTRGATAMLGARADAARATLRRVELDVRRGARLSRAVLEAAYERARLFRDALIPQRRRVLDETLRHYNAMQVGVFELLAARRRLAEAERGYADALGALARARIAFDAWSAGIMVETAATASSPAAEQGNDTNAAHAGH